VVILALAASFASAADSPRDRLPPGAIGRLGTTRLRHSGEVVALAFSPDGKLLLSGGGQGNPAVYLWESRTGERRLRLPVERPVNSVAFSPDSKRIAAGSGSFGGDFEKIVRVWDASTGRELHRLVLGSLVYGSAFSPDGKFLGLNCADGRLLLWEPGKPPRSLGALKGEGHELVFSPDGKLVATGITEWPNPDDFNRKVYVIRLWDSATGKLLHELRGHEESIRALVFSPDGKQLASGGWEKANTVRLWDVATGKELPALENHQGDTRALRFSVDGRTLHAADTAGRLRAWRLPEGKALPAPVPLQDVPYASDAVVISPDGSRLGMGNWLGSSGTANAINLWDLSTGKRILAFPGHEGNVVGLAFRADGKQLASLEPGGAILWDVAERRPLRRFTERLGLLNTVDLSADGKLLAAGDIRMARVHVWDTAAGKESTELSWKPDERGGDRGGGLRFSPDGRSLLVTEPAPLRFQLFSIPGKLPLQQVSLTGLPPLASAGFTPDGRQIVAAWGAGMVRWDAASGKERLRIGQKVDLLSVYGYWTDASAMSPDGRTLALGARNGVVGLWETVTGTEIVRLTTASGDFDRSITAASFSPDSRYVVAGMWGGGFRCWDVLTGEEVSSRSAHDGTIHSLAFTPDGSTLASGSADTTILLWDFSQLIKPRPGAGKPLAAEALEKLWGQLAERDSRSAHRAIASLVDAGAVALLDEKLRPLRADQAERKTIEGLIARLDDARFAERQKASDALKQFGIRAEMPLTKALDKAPSLEVRRRIEEVLNALPKPESDVASGERLRALRTLSVLEKTRTKAAGALLQSLAEQAGDSVVRIEAAAALVRLRHAAKSTAR
jgi:WD40 repeat protein